MGNIFRPDMTAKLVSDIDFQALAEKGFRFIMLDFDNTLAPDHFTEPIPYSYEMVEKMQNAGFSLCLVSNAKSERSKRIADMLKIPCISYAHKPSPSGVIKAMELIGAEKEKTIMLGDQVFTDIIAGNRAGIFTILVDRYSKKEVFYVVLKRFPEWIIRKICRF
ncbi:MAG: YqeG family HAD IIIA-type phosphatase [Clostridiales bacterium]|nr:YqeG family HAD IIIA-type phosphatase [Clostridiales bacterium]